MRVYAVIRVLSTRPPPYNEQHCPLTITPDNFHRSNPKRRLYSMAPKAEYKLSYFNIRGRAEVVRLLFALGDQQFTDNRIEQANWPELKSKTPGGQLPILEVGGIVLTQTTSICRFIARELGLAGSTSLNQAMVDIINTTAGEIVDIIRAVASSSEEGKDAAGEKLKAALASFEEMVNRYKKKDCKFVLADRACLADTAVYFVLETVKTATPDFFPEESSTLAQIFNNFAALPRIAKWIKERPQTDY